MYICNLYFLNLKISPGAAVSSFPQRQGSFGSRSFKLWKHLSCTVVLWNLYFIRKQKLQLFKVPLIAKWAEISTMGCFLNWFDIESWGTGLVLGNDSSMKNPLDRKTSGQFMILWEHRFLTAALLPKQVWCVSTPPQWNLKSFESRLQ